MRRVLIVAYYFPPAGGIGSLRLSAFARHLPEFGWEPLVLAPRDPSYHHDPELTVDERQVIRTGSIELSRAGKSALRAGGDDTVAADVSGVRMWLREVARAVLYFPDAQIGWYPPALLAARRALTRTGIDAVFSSSFPVTAHLIARRLHRHTRAPWVAEFRDPWSQTLPPGNIKRRRAAAFERRLMREPAAAVTVSPSWARMFADAWERPVEVIANGYEGERPPERVVPVQDDDLVVGYLGTYYPGTQDLTGVWAALAGLDVPRRVRLIGAANPSFAHEVAAAGLEGRLEVTGFLSQSRALEELSQCSILVLAGPRDDAALTQGHVVAKVWEYLASELPILYVGNLSADVAEILRSQPGCAEHRPDDIEGIKASISSLQGRRFSRDVAGMSRRARAGALAGLLNSVAVSARH